MHNALPDFQAAMRERGLVPPAEIVPGKLHRFSPSGKRGDDAAWCKFFEDGRGGVFGNWRDGYSESWQARRDRPYTPAEREAFMRQCEEAKREREVAEAKRHAEVRTRAAEIWKAATQAPGDHGYLRRKSIKPHGTKVGADGRLLVPMRDSAGILWNVERIAPEKPTDGSTDKKGLYGGRRTGCYFGIGKPSDSLCIAEGFATAASIHEATGQAVAVAFNAGNLLPVAKALRAKYPELRLILCADDDAATSGNPGITKAKAAASEVGGQLAVPGFGDERPEGASDFNDLAKARGVDAVRACIEAARPIEAPQAASGGGSASYPLPWGVELIRGDSIKPEPISWLWEGWLAGGKLHVIAGAPGTGKTTLALGLAATLSVGGRWPDGTRAITGDVLIWSGEDSPKDTLVPRLYACGANLARVHFIGQTTGEDGPRPFDPAHDFAALALEAARLPSLRLVIVDPIVSAIKGDSHKNAEVRNGLQPLVNFGEATGCAIVGISHFSKGTAGRDPVERVTGSLAFGALARLVFATVKESEENGGGRLLVRSKSNIGPDGGGFRYELRQVELSGDCAGITASRPEWREEVKGEAREILATAEHDSDPEERSALDDAMQFLEHALETGAVHQRDLMKDADGMGISKTTLQRAKKVLRVESVKEAMAGGWLWKLPPKIAKNPEVAQQKVVDTFGKFGHLRADFDAESEVP